MKSQKIQVAQLGRLFQLKNLDYNNLKKRIKSNEGFSLKPYKDQLGYLTIGHGHLILSNEKIFLKNKIHKKELEEIFEKDTHDIVHDALKEARASLNYLKDVKAPPREQLTSQFMEGQVW